MQDVQGPDLAGRHALAGWVFSVPHRSPTLRLTAREMRFVIVDRFSQAEFVQRLRQGRATEVGIVQRVFPRLAAPVPSPRAQHPCAPCAVMQLDDKPTLVAQTVEVG
jgi:hypothetical protein